MSVAQIFQLSEEFNNANIRICTIDDVKYVSVLDVIDVLLGEERSNSTNVSKYWSRVVTNNPDVVSQILNFKFKGQGQRDTPIADGQTIMEIIMLVPGKAANKFRAVSAAKLLAVLNPSIEFIEDLEQRRLAIALGNEPPPLRSSYTVEHGARAQGECRLYIRAQLPPELVQDIQCRKLLTLYVLKFGLTYDLQKRLNDYAKDHGDNGFFLYSFLLNSRAEADMVERALKHQFSEYTAYDSYEYTLLH